MDGEQLVVVMNDVKICCNEKKAQHTWLVLYTFAQEQHGIAERTWGNRVLRCRKCTMKPQIRL